MVQMPAWFDRLAPRGSLGRYAVAGVFNTAVFAVMLVVLGWAGGVTREQSEAWAVVWGIAWMGSSIVAHWVHRGFSFIPSTKIAYSLSTALPITPFLHRLLSDLRFDPRVHHVVHLVHHRHQHRGGASRSGC